MTETSSFSRGDIVLCALPGDYGKPRPAVVVQSDLFNETHDSVTLCPVSSELTGLDLFRVPLDASLATGLKVNSEIMVDKLSAVRRRRVKRRIGRLAASEMKAVEMVLRTWLDLPGGAGDPL